MTDEYDLDAMRSQVRGIYDAHSRTFLEYAGSTFQSGLLKVGAEGREDPRAHNLELARRAGVLSSDHMLDCGCGVGGPAMDVAEAFPEVRIDAVTISPVQVELGENLATERGLADRVRFHAADYHELPFADASFDIVWFLESAEYSWDQKALFAEAFRVLKPGGRLFQKGLFRREGEITGLPLEHLRELEEVWGVSAGLPSPAETWGAIGAAGFIIRHAGLLDGEVGQDRYVGSMIEVGPTGIPQLNPFGKVVFVPHSDIPLCYAECRATKPG
ncbi:MAG: methyltransferase domain-containing protein [Deltaproteobacteria bacterium]|nr:methyltransferase domain-containing protein [Deltaproteobacteria bacterium]